MIVYIYMWLYIYIKDCIHIYIWLYIFICDCIYMWLYIYIYMWLYIYIYICDCVYIYMIVYMHDAWCLYITSCFRLIFPNMSKLRTANQVYTKSWLCLSVCITIPRAFWRIHCFHTQLCRTSHQLQWRMLSSVRPWPDLKTRRSESCSSSLLSLGAAKDSWVSYPLVI